MVSFYSTSPSMEFKNLTFSDQFQSFASSVRRKVVSPFGLGIVLSFIVLSVVLFNISFKTPFFNPVFQGFNRFGSHSNSSFLSWPFSFSSAPAFSSALNDTGACNGTSSIVQNSRHPVFVNETFEANVVRNNKSRDSLNSDGKDEVSERNHLGTEPGKLKDGSFVVGEGSVGVKTDGRNGSLADENPILRNSGGKEKELENAHVMYSSENVKNESVGVKKSAVEGKDERRENSLERNSTGQITEAPEDSNAGNSTYLNANNSSYKECDVFDGEWVRDDTKPYYPPGSCPYIDKDFDCHLNGRPDNEFVKWRWQPYGCEVPRFNATDFLERLRGQKLVFVGDSLNRNMWESLVCLLRHSVPDKEQVYEISGRREFKKKGFYAFRFEDYNCSVDFVSSPFLVKESSFNAKNGSFERLRLDLMDGTTSMYHDADVIIFNTGHWWTHEKTSRGEYYYQEGNYVHPRLKVMEAYKRALSTWAGWVDSNIDGSRTQVIFRGFSVTHFRGGPWNSGGQCNKETEPIFNKTYLAKYPSKMKVFEHALKSMKTPVTYLNISRLTDYRKDGHPSVYRSDYQAAQQDNANVHVQDCSHWCLPGVPDTWNELLYASLLRNGRGSWRV